MALKIPRTGLTELLKDGYRHYSGLEEAVFRNINACKELSQVTRTSLGPNGKNKMIVNHLEKLFVTNDAATIMKEMEVQHPAARLLVMASEQQQKEVGDASNFVVVFAGELLMKAEALLKMGLHPSDVVEGYNRASRKALELLDSLTVKSIGNLRDRAEVIASVRASIASKQFGHEDFLSGLIADAIVSIMPENTKNFNIDNVRVIKVMGAGLRDSTFLRGMVFEREPDTTIQRVEKAKVAVFTCGIDIQRTETKGTVLLHNSDELLRFSKGEEEGLEKAIKEIADAGINVVVTGSGIGELALHFLNRYNLLATKVLSKFDLRRLCKAIGATPLARLGAPTAEEVGAVDLVETTEIGSDRVTIFRQLRDDAASALATIVIRGATKNLMDDVERAVDDAVNTVRVVSRDSRVLAGAGAVEIELARQLVSLADTTPGLEQYAIKKFAEAFEVIPRTLAENAGLNATEIVAKMYSAHQAGKAYAGVDVESDEGALLDAAEKVIFDAHTTKYWAIKYATEAAVTVLKVDQIIMSKPSGGPKPRENPNWDED